MPPEVLVIRFPDGSREFRFPDKALEEGDVLWHDDRRYRVISTSSDGDGASFAVVEPESASLGELLQSEEGAIRLTPTDAFESPRDEGVMV